MKTSYPNEEVNRTEPSPSVSVPWIKIFYENLRIERLIISCINLDMQASACKDLDT